MVSIAEDSLSSVFLKSLCFGTFLCMCACDKVMLVYQTIGEDLFSHRDLYCFYIGIGGVCVCLSVCVCMCEREKQTERQRLRDRERTHNGRKSEENTVTILPSFYICVGLKAQTQMLNVSQFTPDRKYSKSKCHPGSGLFLVFSFLCITI